MKYTNQPQDDRSTPDLSSAPRPLTDDDVAGYGKYYDTKLKDIPISHYEWMMDEQAKYPRVQRSPRWVQVMEWVRRKGLKSGF